MGGENSSGGVKMAIPTSVVGRDVGMASNTRVRVHNFFTHTIGDEVEMVTFSGVYMHLVLDA
jgi:hypothetical protein